MASNFIESVWLQKYVYLGLEGVIAIPLQHLLDISMGVSLKLPHDKKS